MGLLNCACYFNVCISTVIDICCFSDFSELLKNVGTRGRKFRQLISSDSVIWVALIGGKPVGKIDCEAVNEKVPY